MLINFENRGDKPILSAYPFFIMGEGRGEETSDLQLSILKSQHHVKLYTRR
jgi:hypothetical protein